MKYLSQSRISTYKQCPRKYWYRYVKKLKPSEKWPHLIKGNFVHDVLESWIKEVLNNKEARAAIQNAYEYWRYSEKYKALSIEKYIEEIKPWIYQVYRDYQRRQYRPVAAEQKVQFRYRGIVMTGRIDRVDEVSPTRIKIVDYKTTKDPQYLTGLQLGIYYMGAKYGSLRSAYGDKDIETAYVLLRHDVDEVKYTFSPDQLDGMLDEIENAAISIFSEKEWPARPSHMCRFCDYYVPCTKERESVDNWW